MRDPAKCYRFMFSRNPDPRLAKGVDGTRSVTQWTWELFKCPPLNPPPAFRYLSKTAVAVLRPGESHTGCSFVDSCQFLSGRSRGHRGKLTVEAVLVPVDLNFSGKQK